MQIPTSVPSMNQTQTYDYGASPQVPPTNFQQPFIDGQHPNYSDMLIESQDVDMSGTNGNFAFPGGDMIPWLEYLPQDVLNFFGDPNDDSGLGMNPGAGDGQGKTG